MKNFREIRGLRQCQTCHRTRKSDSDSARNIYLSGLHSVRKDPLPLTYTEKLNSVHQLDWRRSLESGDLQLRVKHALSV